MFSGWPFPIYVKIMWSEEGDWVLNMREEITAEKVIRSKVSESEQGNIYSLH